MDAIVIHSKDNVAVALRDLKTGESITIKAVGITVRSDIPQGHKFAVTSIPEGGEIIKYGVSIGHTISGVFPGEYIHVHNVKTNLTEYGVYEYLPNKDLLGQYSTESVNDTFSGFLRSDGKVGIRNEIWIIPTVGCVNSVADRLAKANQHLVQGSMDGLYAYTHPYGCSQLGDDHINTRRILATLAQHPNAGGVLVLGLGCENNTMTEFKQELQLWDDNRVKFLIAQESDDELADGSALLAQLAENASIARRSEIPVSKLVVGMKCGGSDGLSGITANPLVGAFSDLLVKKGGSTILTEIPEIFGAESLLLSRCVNREVFDKAVDVINNFKHYYVSHGQNVYENPSPGNKSGGITTLEDKSCGCIQKGGSAPLSDVIRYGEKVKTAGLTLLEGPGNDLVSATALTVAGAQLILFTTGRGTPFGAPAPTLKISSNSELSQKKPNWIDFNAGTIIEGESLSQAAERLYQLVLETASGRRINNELNGYREISIFKDGVTL